LLLEGLTPEEVGFPLNAHSTYQALEDPGGNFQMAAFSTDKKAHSSYSRRKHQHSMRGIINQLKVFYALRPERIAIHAGHKAVSCVVMAHYICIILERA
jgi:hypothetical protein